ncbi:MAG TPA: response regulator transcription factor [Pyrinomonadaceae bacterium]|nr:response regulator transcription factor [Pyrinomonadaceae bacterium]
MNRISPNPPLPDSLTQITVLIADDHPVFRRGLRLIIQSDQQINIIAEADNGRKALELIHSSKPDVAVLDVNMPEMTGFEVVRELRKTNLTTEFIFLTMHKDEAMFNTALELGVKGYLLKESAIEDIAAGIKAVAAGENFISPPLATFLVNRSRRNAAFAAARPAIDDLTVTERRVLKMIAEDKTSREIADQLSISVRTVERHRQNVCDKLEIHGSNSLMKFALANKEQLQH